MMAVWVNLAISLAVFTPSMASKRYLHWNLKTLEFTICLKLKKLVHWKASRAGKEFYSSICSMPNTSFKKNILDSIRDEDEAF